MTVTSSPEISTRSSHPARVSPRDLDQELVRVAIERARARTTDVARLGDLEQLRSDHPGDARVRRALAEEYLAQGHEIEARTELAFLLEIAPSARDTLPPRLKALADELPGWATPDHHGGVLAELEHIRTWPNIADRIAGYRDATRRFPDDDRVWFNLATDLERAGDRRGAAEAMQQALALNRRLRAHLPPEFREPAEHALDPARELPGKRIELYTVERVLAVHESQVLCEAKVASQDTRVILRRLLGIPVAQAKAMLQDELRVERPEQLVPVIDLVYDEERRPYQVLAHFSGSSLSELRRSGVLTMDEKLETMCAVIEAVGRLHERGLVHGDLRPEHVLRVSRTPLRIQLLGARGNAGSGRVLPPGQAAWAAPEEATRVDQKTDVYCLGLLLYHVFGDGSLPPLRERATTALAAVGGATGSLSRIDAVIRKCTEIDPGQRYASCAELRQALRDIIDEAEDLSGQMLGRYRLYAMLGRGGFGTVYQAEDLKFGSRAAVKVLRSSLASSGEKRQRFFNEAHAARRVRHPNVIVVDDYGTDHGHHFIGMELLKGGQTLGALIEQEPLDIGTTLAIGIQLASALADQGGAEQQPGDGRRAAGAWRVAGGARAGGPRRRLVERGDHAADVRREVRREARLGSGGAEAARGRRRRACPERRGAERHLHGQARGHGPAPDPARRRRERQGPGRRHAADGRGRSR